jgi:hypothetical protein
MMGPGLTQGEMHFDVSQHAWTMQAVPLGQSSVLVQSGRSSQAASSPQKPVPSAVVAQPQNSPHISNPARHVPREQVAGGLGHLRLWRPASTRVESATTRRRRAVIEKRMVSIIREGVQLYSFGQEPSTWDSADFI